MGKMKENPRYNVLSFRVSDEELGQITKLVTELNVTISDLLLNSIQSVLSLRETTHADQT